MTHPTAPTLDDTPTLALARDLLARPSITPDDAGCQQLIGERLKACGFTLETLAEGGVINLWATRGTGTTLAFAGHTDVVPTGPIEQWQTPPFEPTIDEEGYLRARGAADMKGSVASMVTAVERFVAAHPDHQGRLAFLITSDEEGPAIHGTRMVVDALRERGEQLDYCIVGEPSSVDTLGDMVKNGRRGSLNATLTVIGQQGHVAYPHKARNPIHMALSALDELTRTQWDDGHDGFPPTSFQISNLNSGTGAENVIPGELTARFNFRFSTAFTADELKARVAEVLTRHGLVEGESFTLDWSLSGNPFVTLPGRLLDAVSHAVEAECQRAPVLSTSGGTSDGRFISTLGTQVIELGPVNATIHQVDERILADDLNTLSRVYERILTTLFADQA